MRRILAGMVSGVAGGAVYFTLLSYIGESDLVLFAAIAATLATYGAIDWTGALPALFQRDIRSIVHDEDQDQT